MTPPLQIFCSSCTDKQWRRPAKQKRKTQWDPTTCKAESRHQSSLWGQVWHRISLAPTHRFEKCIQMPWCCMHTKDQIHLSATSVCHCALDVLQVQGNVGPGAAWYRERRSEFHEAANVLLFLMNLRRKLAKPRNRCSCLWGVGRVSAITSPSVITTNNCSCR